MFVVSVVFAITSLTPVGFIFGLLLLVVFLLYGYDVLEETSQGHLEAKPFGGDLLTDDLFRRAKQIAIIVLFLLLDNYITSGMGFAFSGIGYELFGRSIIALVLPASIMILAVNDSFFRAINPIILFDTVQRIGGPYFIMYFFLMLLINSLMYVTIWMVDFLPSVIYQPLWFFVGMYFMLIMFNMMGYVLYQYHEELDYSISEEFSDSSTATTLVDFDPALREVEILFQEGKVDEARQRLLRLIRDNPGNLIYRERLHKLHINLGRIEQMHESSADYIVRLLSEQRPSEAQRVFSECYQLDKTFKFGTGRQRHAMAKLLYKNGQARAALALLNNMHQDYPGYEGIPDAYLLVAKILCETFNEDTKAEQVLDFLQKKYSQHPCNVDVQAYRKVVASLAER